MEQQKNIHPGAIKSAIITYIIILDKIFKTEAIK